MVETPEEYEARTSKQAKLAASARQAEYLEMLDSDDLPKKLKGILDENNPHRDEMIDCLCGTMRQNFSPSSYRQVYLRLMEIVHDDTIDRKEKAKRLWRLRINPLDVDRTYDKYVMGWHEQGPQESAEE